MGTCTCSQTCALGTQAFSRFNPLSLFGSNWRDPESAKHFHDFSLCQQQATSASASGAHAESLTPEACIEEHPDGEASPVTSFHSPPHSVHTPTTSSTNSGGSKASPDVKGKTSTSTSSTSKPDLMSKLGSNGKLTSDEQKRHFDNKLCMFCGAGGHMAEDCPKSTSRTSKGRSVTTTLATKPEDSSESNK